MPYDELAIVKSDQIKTEMAGTLSDSKNWILAESLLFLNQLRWF
jgi:hypothetical protein